MREKLEKSKETRVPPFDEGGSPTFGNKVHRSSNFFLQTYAQEGIPFQYSLADGSGSNSLTPNFLFPCPMQTEEEIHQPPLHSPSLSDNPNLSLRKQKKWARKRCLPSLSDKKDLSPPKRKRKDTDVDIQLANPKRPKSHDAVTLQDEPLHPSNRAAAAMQPCRPL
ncbi:hypothetical protein U1Q18_027205 [Sarracenia purpurea var. burkii]